MKLIGITIIAIGIAGMIHDWLLRHQNRRKRMEELLSFFRKAVYAMEELKVHWITYFEEYEGADICLNKSVWETAQRLKQNCYAKGELAWQEVMKEKKADWDFSKEAFLLLLSSGTAFFGKSQKENLEFLRLYIKLLDEQNKKECLEFAEKKKVWIPIGTLGGIMLVIILL